MNHPLLSMRLRANDTDTPENWKETFRAIASNPGCCDEIWFSTGIGVPPLEWHRRQAATIACAIDNLKCIVILRPLRHPMLNDLKMAGVIFKSNSMHKIKWNIT